MLQELHEVVSSDHTGGDDIGNRSHVVGVDLKLCVRVSFVV